MPKLRAHSSLPSRAEAQSALLPPQQGRSSERTPPSPAGHRVASFLGVLQPLGFIDSPGEKAVLALKLISGTVTQGEAGIQLTAIIVMCLHHISAHRVKPFMREHFAIRSKESTWNRFLSHTESSVVSEKHVVHPLKSLKNYVEV